MCPAEDERPAPPGPRQKRHYIPHINRFLISVLYHEAKSRKMPMTKLTEHLLTESLSGTEGWRVAEASLDQDEAE